MDHIYKQSPEDFRNYGYADGTNFYIRDVIGSAVDNDGTHYIKCAGGVKFIVVPGWRTLEIQTPKVSA